MRSSTLRATAVAVVVAVVVLFAVLFYLRVSRVSGQVGDVTGLVTNQTARVDRLLGTQLAVVQGLLVQTQRLAQAQRALTRTATRTAREVHLVLARFQLLFRRVLRGLRGQLPAQTRTLVTAIERGLRRLLSLQKRR